MNFIAEGNRAAKACCRSVLPVGRVRLRIFLPAALHKMTDRPPLLCRVNNASAEFPIIKIKQSRLFGLPNKNIIFRQKQKAGINPSGESGIAGKQLFRFFVKCSLGAAGPVCVPNGHGGAS